MRITTTLMLGGLCLAVVIAAPLRLAAQTELDHIVARINNRIITSSDIQRARRLQLVDNPSSDESTRRGLEDRALMLSELSRLPPVAQSAGDDVAARRTDWEASVGGPARATALLGETQMTDASLQSWLRDDARIQGYLKRQFGSLPDADRAKATADWITRLRQRAGLR